MTSPVLSSASASARRVTPQAQSTRNKLIEAAYTCFDRYGVQKTTMEDVASGAGYSRQTVYKHFPNKDELLTAISLLESDKLNAAIQRRSAQRTDVRDKMVDSILATLQEGRVNPYIRRLLEPEDMQSRTTRKDDPLHASQRARWEPLLEEARASGAMADDLDIDEAVSWLTLMQMSLLLKQDQSQLDTPELERLVRRFIVAPIFSRP